LQYHEEIEGCPPRTEWDPEASAAAFRVATRLATNTREQHHPTLQAARLAAGTR